MASTSLNSSNTRLITLSDMALKIFHRTGKIQRAADGFRSRDLVLTKHALYQAELRRLYVLFTSARQKRVRLRRILFLPVNPKLSALFPRLEVLFLLFGILVYFHSKR